MLKKIQCIRFVLIWLCYSMWPDAVRPIHLSFAYDHSRYWRLGQSARIRHSKAMVLCHLLWYSTLQWPGRAASFESQGSCPSPKPQTPWWSQVVMTPPQKETKCLFGVARKWKLCCLWIICEHFLWKFIPTHFLCDCAYVCVSIYSFKFLFVECSTELAMHSTHCQFYTYALKFSDIHTNNMNSRPRCKTSVVYSQLCQPQHSKLHFFGI